MGESERRNGPVHPRARKIINSFLCRPCGSAATQVFMVLAVLHTDFSDEFLGLGASFSVQALGIPSGNQFAANCWKTLKEDLGNVEDWTWLAHTCNDCEPDSRVDESYDVSVHTLVHTPDQVYSQAHSCLVRQEG